MFPSVKTRLTVAARRGLVLAVEFATLGEYAVAAPRQPRAEEAVSGGSGLPFHPRDGQLSIPAPPPGVSAARPRAERLRPATAAARRLQPPPPPQRVAPHSGVRALALAGDGPAPRRAGRTRAGAARPRPQPCLVAESGVPRTMRG